MAEGAPDASKGLRGLIPSDEVTRHLVNLPLCTEAGYIRIRLGLGLGWARVGLERIRNGPSVGGSFAATWAHRNASESRGASNGRTSGQLFSAASRAQLPTQRALDSPIYGLSSAPSRGSWARNGAQAEHRTCHGLAPVATALGLHCRGRGSFHKTTHNRSGIRSVCMATPRARRGG